VDKSITALAVVGTLGLATTTRAEPITREPARERAVRVAALLLLSVAMACGKPAPAADESRPDAVGKPGETQRISISERVAKDAGLRVAQVEMATLPATVELIGEVAADPDRMAKVPVRVPGRLVEVRFQEGQRVAAGDVLAAIESSEVARIRAELTSTSTRSEAAHKRADRLARLVEAGTASAQDLETARAETSVLDAEVSAARQTLASIGGGGGATARLQIRAPIAGVVLKRDGVVGQPVGADHVVAEIVDLSHAVFLARLFEHDLVRLHEGATAEVRLDAYPELPFPGKVITIGRQVEPVARAVLARIAIDDNDARLKIGLFGTVVVMIPDPTAMPAMPVVPASAVTKIDDHAVVFVEVAPRAFEPRAVELGHAMDGKVEILHGLKAGDRIATGAVFTLKSLALKASFGEDD
jgi:membrane fusion protein, heavy metal efflux system